MSSLPPTPPTPPLTPDEERRRKSTRIAITILAASGGCGCLFFVAAFLVGMAIGFVDAKNKHDARPTPTEEEPLELRFQ